MSRNSFILRNALATLTLAASLGAHAATIDIKGDVTQEATQHNSPTSALAVGPGASAEATANTVEGNVRVGGNLRQILNQRNSPTSALAIGIGARAKARVNAIVN